MIIRVQRKLQIFRRDVLGILSPPAHRTSRASSSVLRRNPRLRKRFKSLRDQFRRSAVRTSLKKKHSKRENKNTKLSATEDVRSCSTAKVKKETSQHENHDDIDDIFASKGWWHLRIRWCLVTNTVCTSVTFLPDTDVHIIKDQTLRQGCKLASEEDVTKVSQPLGPACGQ